MHHTTDAHTHADWIFGLWEQCARSRPSSKPGAKRGMSLYTHAPVCVCRCRHACVCIHGSVLCAGAVPGRKAAGEARHASAFVPAAHPWPDPSPTDAGRAGGRRAPSGSRSWSRTAPHSGGPCPALPSVEGVGREAALHGARVAAGLRRPVSAGARGHGDGGQHGSAGFRPLRPGRARPAATAVSRQDGGRAGRGSLPPEAPLARATRWSRRWRRL